MSGVEALRVFLVLLAIAMGIMLGVHATWLTVSHVTLAVAVVLIVYITRFYQSPNEISHWYTAVTMLSLVIVVVLWCTAFVHLLVRFLSGEVIVISIKDFFR